MAETFTALFPFCGLGAGARGFLQAMARLGRDGEARFVNLGGIDIDEESCADFEYLTGGRALRADLSALAPAELLAFAGPRRPDCVFLSPPCKGFSRLLPRAASEAAKYQALNRLVLQGLFLVCETWAEPPPAIILENVPGIMSRGAPLLAQARQLLSSYGYVFHEGTHDCGEVGGLGQHRRRFLLVARRPAAVPSFIYRPPLQRVKACGEILGPLPMPEDPSAGRHHRMPRISWLNWVRLALIPAGGDWRDLPAAIPAAALEQTGTGATSFKGRPGHFEVSDWQEPTRAITGAATVSGSAGVAAVADPRLVTPVQKGQARREVFAKYDVRPWTEPARTVAGSGTNGGFAVADPRLPANPNRHEAKFRVTAWKAPAHAVTAARPVTSGGPSVADPRVALDHSPYRGALGVVAWEEPAPTVRGAHNVRTGPGSVADPRLNCTARGGAYGVISWQEAASTITGNGCIDNGRFAVADPRKPPQGRVPAIVAEDGTWHRPITVLERAALQGIPSTINGKALELAGTSTAGHSERVGNAVPVQAATAIAIAILKALLAASLGTWFLSAEGIWVRRDGHHEELSMEAA